MGEHLLGRLMHRPPTRGDVLIGFPLTGQPLRGEEPRLIGRDRHIAADRDCPVVMDRELHLIQRRPGNITGAAADWVCPVDSADRPRPSGRARPAVPGLPGS